MAKLTILWYEKYSTSLERTGSWLPFQKTVKSKALSVDDEFTLRFWITFKLTSSKTVFFRWCNMRLPNCEKKVDFLAYSLTNRLRTILDLNFSIGHWEYDMWGCCYIVPHFLCRHNSPKHNLLPPSGVVYFDQGLGAGHSKHWLK